MEFAVTLIDEDGDMVPALWCAGCAYNMGKQAGARWKIIPLQDSQDVDAFVCDCCLTDEPDSMLLYESARTTEDMERAFNANHRPVHPAQ